ncbi:MAG TPA: oxaloacetate-decarboxylating malate dehydrogenase, partial [Polyangiales bacterium]|nr:oxaloacetate-decarboxylating malate dehydrogenase [Polyangiales bacterium]
SSTTPTSSRSKDLLAERRPPNPSTEGRPSLALRSRSETGDHDPRNVQLNKGTAFSERERDLFDLHGLLPPNVGTLDEQVDRRLNERCIVVSDGERILGLGDHGAGGMGIPIGKLALYSALGGIHPGHCLPILLDVGTDNRALLDNPLYIGWTHERIRGQEYDAFVDTFVSCVQQRWPDVLLQWEDFAGANATRLLDRYRDQLCTFNDDIQGTAATAAATLMSAIQRTALGLHEQRIVIFGFGGAGVGIAKLLVQWLIEEGVSPIKAHRSIYAIDRAGLITERSSGLRAEQLSFARSENEVRGWKRSGADELGLFDVIRAVKPTALIGVSGQSGAFDEQSVREMAAHTARPVIFPLSNPTSRCEANPRALLEWSGGRALIGTGSPFAPIELGGESYAITQTNNAYVFPGLALGVVAARAQRVSDGMMMAAARELARLAQRKGNDRLLPPISEARVLSCAIAIAVCRCAIREGHSGLTEASVEAAIDGQIWEPVYAEYERTSDFDIDSVRRSPESGRA